MTEPFREKVEPAVEPVAKGKNPEVTSLSKVEVPYLDYQNSNGKPYIVDHYDMGSHWDDRVGGFPEEVRTIDNYLQEQIKDGQLDNSIKGIKQRLKEIEKVTGMTNETRNVVKLEVISEYMKFLSKTRDIKQNITRYGNN